MRLLLVTDDFPPALGGIASYLRDLYGDSPRLVRPPFLAALRAIRRTRPDVLFAGTLLSSGVLVFLASRLFRIPYALHVYGTDLTTRRRSPLVQRVARMVLRRAARVIVISDFGACAAAELGVDPSRIVKIVPPVDTERFTPAARGSGGPPLLLTVARLVPRKGHDTVLRALPLVLARIPDLQYAIVGEGPERARLEALARELGVERAVQFAGAAVDVVPWYQSCDLFVMMSRDEEGEVEGFGISFTEAAACAKPAIGGRSGGTAEAVLDGVTGLLVEDEHSLADAIVNLLTDRETAARMGREGRERAVRELSVAAAAEQLRRVAEELTR
ncbi:MAG TPA: glycosyltransferase family 4 protein [Thermoanaerobaculia bacterium]|nr:glycosyltransferase family 4 protein [Thermoanaerobaculia bacterium]